MPRHKKSTRNPQEALDTLSRKRPRGRPGACFSEIAGRSYQLGLQFGQVWNVAGEKLTQAKTDDEVIAAIALAGQYYKEQFHGTGIPTLILRIVRDPRFPKRREARIRFLANSLAAWGMVSPRRSRDICEKERNKKVNYITRQDYYIECTCRYKGPALHGRCPKCGTDKMDLPFRLNLGT